MTDLAAFRRAVREGLRSVGRTQQQLARSIGVHPNVLSRKLNRYERSTLTVRDCRVIVATLVEWGAVNTQGEADVLLRLAAVPSRVVITESWYASLPESLPHVLAPTHAPPTASSGSSVSSASSWRLSEVQESLRPIAPPQPVTPFIGRAAVVAAVCTTLREARLVELIGLGGAGKTRVGLEVARVLAPEFPDGVAFVDLGPVTDPAAIAPALARALGLPEPAGNATEQQLATALRSAQLLLLIDSIEHLEAGSDLLGRLLTRAPRVRALVTSRVPLHLYGEHRFRVPPLTLPDDMAATAAGVRDSEAVQLFLSRARALSPGMDPHGEALEAVAEICTALDGLPLSIELAAAQTPLWSPQAIRNRLDERLRFTGDARDVPDRHRSLQATLAWSEALLSPPTRHLFARLGIFVGSFDAAAAEAAVTEGADGVPGVVGPSRGRVQASLAELTDHSLVEVTEVGSSEGVTRFRMLESVREYAAIRLRETGKLEPAGATCRTT